MSITRRYRICPWADLRFEPPRELYGIETQAAKGERWVKVASPSAEHLECLLFPTRSEAIRWMRHRRLDDYERSLQEAVLERVRERFNLELQGDLENGVKSLNEEAAARFHKEHPGLSAFWAWLESDQPLQPPTNHDQ